MLIAFKLVTCCAHFGSRHCALAFPADCCIPRLQILVLGFCDNQRDEELIWKILSQVSKPIGPLTNASSSSQIKHPRSWSTLVLAPFTWVNSSPCLGLFSPTKVHNIVYRIVWKSHTTLPRLCIIVEHTAMAACHHLHLQEHVC